MLAGLGAAIAIRLVAPAFPATITRHSTLQLRDLPPMLTGEIRGQIDRIWDAFWSGGISNPLEVIEQITYLLFIKRLDDLHTLETALRARELRPDNPRYQRAIRVWQRLPVGLTKLLGPAIVRGIP